MTPQQPRDEETPEEPIVVKDRRRVDAETGQVRPEAAQQPTEETVQPPTAAPGEHGAPHPEGQDGGSAAPSSPGAQPAGDDELRKQVDELTADLKRVQAEYANYRKRVDRDREAVTMTAKASLVEELLPLLDDIGRAEEHGDLTGAFKAVADKLVGALDKAGLEPYGEENEPFDPAVHEAVQHDTSPDVTGPTVTTVLRRGYRLGDRVLRLALVGVTDHEPEQSNQPAAAPDNGGATDADGSTGPISAPDSEPAGWFEPSEPGSGDPGGSSTGSSSAQ